VISHDLFTMIVTMAVVTTLAMPPMLRWALSRLPVHEEESALRTNLLPAETAITREAQKGYGLLVLGMAKTVSPHGGIARIAAMYEGPIAVVVARGVHVDDSQKGHLNILVPFRGNKVSRRAAEVALALTRPSDPPLTALYVLSTVGLGAAQRRLKRPTPTRRHEEAVLKEIVELADHYGRSIRTALRLDIAPEDAILRQASPGNYNLIVMGVGRQAGETLFFGRVAAAVLENSDRSLLFVSS
jgi:nucleotide-binding universal stress UspA family protein